MSGRKVDFSLVVGADVDLSYNQMLDDIQRVVTKINENPFKINVKLGLSESEESKFRSQITQIVGSLNASGAIDVQVNSSNEKSIQNIVNGVSDIATKAEAATHSIGAMSASLDRINIQKINDALQSIDGVSERTAAKITDGLSNANVKIDEARIRLEAVGEEENRIVNLRVKGTDSLGKTVNYSILYDKKTGEIRSKLTDIVVKRQREKELVDETAKKSEESATVEKRREVSVSKVSDLYRKMLEAMQSKDSMRGKTPFSDVEDHAERFRKALVMVEEQAVSIDEALERVGYKGKDAIEEVKNSISDLRREASSIADIRRESKAIDTRYSKLEKGFGLIDADTDINALKEKYSEYSAAVSQLRKNENNASEEEIGNIRRLKDETESLMETVSRRIDKEKEERKELNEYLSLYNRISKAKKNWTAARNGQSSGEYENLSKYLEKLDELKSKYDSHKLDDESFAKGISKVGESFKQSSIEIEKNGENIKSWQSRLGNITSKLGKNLILVKALEFSYRQIKEMVKSVIELDTAMTELKKVTDETESVYEKFLDNTTERSKRLGATLSDVVSATADFARLGFSIDDAANLADVAIIYKNVGDGIKNIDEASKSIIATIQAFGIDAKNAISIVDKFNAVGNKFAISSSGVGEALLRSAAAMRAAGNTIDETISLAAAANSIIQNPEKVGTTLKTVSMFLRASKTEAAEAGEATDGMATSVSKLREEILSLTGGKVDIQIDEDNFKSTYQILKEISLVWHDLSDITRANILEKIGGKRNSNVVAALLENFSVAEEALEVSSDSAGSALAENEKYLELDHSLLLAGVGDSSLAQKCA